jgi:hypothetical protein
MLGLLGLLGLLGFLGLLGKICHNLKISSILIGTTRVILDSSLATFS